jgi:predicted transcriptional regulator
MGTKTAPELIRVPEDARRVVREIRTRLGLSRATVEKRAKVGTDYVKRLELGQWQSASSAYRSKRMPA